MDGPEAVTFGLLKAHDFVMRLPKDVEKNKPRDPRFWQLAQGDCATCTERDLRKYILDADATNNYYRQFPEHRAQYMITPETYDPERQAREFNDMVIEQVNLAKEMAAKKSAIEQMNIVWNMDKRLTFFFKNWDPYHTGPEDRIVINNYLVNVFSLQIPKILTILENLRETILAWNRDENLIKMISAKELHADFQNNPDFPGDEAVPFYVDVVTGVVSQFAMAPINIISTLGFIKKHALERVPELKNITLKQSLGLRRDIIHELDILEYKMKNIQMASELVHLDQSIAKLGELENDENQQNRSRNLLNSDRIAGYGAKAWPAKIAKEILGIQGKTVTKRQTLVKVLNTVKHVLMRKTKAQRREKRLENAYEAKKDAIQSIIQKLEPQHFPKEEIPKDLDNAMNAQLQKAMLFNAERMIRELEALHGLKVPEFCTAAQLKTALVSYRKALISDMEASETRLTQLESEVFDNDRFIK